jgi:hypothetical protein
MLHVAGIPDSKTGARDASGAGQIDAPATSMNVYEARPPRFAVHQRVVLVGPDGTERAATITNVSRLGFRLKVSATPAIGAQVIIRGEAGDVPAQIRWAIGADAGGMFMPPKDD